MAGEQARLFPSSWDWVDFAFLLVHSVNGDFGFVSVNLARLDGGIYRRDRSGECGWIVILL